MKTPRCKQCKGTGIEHIDVPNAIFQYGKPKTFDLPCDLCGGGNFKGMNRDQISWYLKMHKALESLIQKSLREEKIVSPDAWTKLKNAINTASMRLKISTQSIAYTKATHYGQTTVYLHMKAEFAEYRRRLKMIPVW